jgi:mannose-6-phosphate isomerase-like protein (cupin superfamily)
MHYTLDEVMLGKRYTKSLSSTAAVQEPHSVDEVYYVIEGNAFIKLAIIVPVVGEKIVIS